MINILHNYNEAYLVHHDAGKPILTPVGSPRVPDMPIFHAILYSPSNNLSQTMPVLLTGYNELALFNALCKGRSKDTTVLYLHSVKQVKPVVGLLQNYSTLSHLHQKHHYFYTINVLKNREYNKTLKSLLLQKSSTAVVEESSYKCMA